VRYTEQGAVTVTNRARFRARRRHGVGMSAEDLDRVFPALLPRQQPDAAGHGVGLTIVKRLSDRFGWRVVLESQLGVVTRANDQVSKSHPV